MTRTAAKSTPTMEPALRAALPVQRFLQNNLTHGPNCDSILEQPSKAIQQYSLPFTIALGQALVRLSGGGIPDFLDLHRTLNMGTPVLVGNTKISRTRYQVQR